MTAPARAARDRSTRRAIAAGVERVRCRTALGRALLVLALLCCGGVPAPALTPPVRAQAVAPAAAPDVAPASAPAGAARRQAAPDAKPRTGAATVMVYNRPIVEFRAPFLGADPSYRAAVATRRIEGLLERGGAGVVATETIPQGVMVTLDGTLALVVTPDDADPVNGETIEAVAAGAAQALQRVAAETREARDLRLMGRAALAAAAGTLVLGLVLWGLVRVRRAAARRFAALARSRAEGLRLGGVEVIVRDRLRVLAERAVGVTFWVLVLVVVYEWLGFVLERFPYTRPWGEGLNAFLFDTGSGFLAAIAKALPGLAIAVAIFFLARFVVELARGFFDRVETGQIEVGWLDRETVRPTRRLAAIVVWIFALVMAYPYLPGADTDAFKGVSVLIGLMLSIGGASVVGQAASGLILMYARTVRPGEYVRIGEHEGTVVEVGMFYTRIRTGIGEELTLPNGVVTGAVTKNYSRAVQGAGFVLDTSVTIGYDTPWRQVHAMLAEAARRTPGILAEPVPRVIQTALGDFYVEYRLVCQALPSAPQPRVEVLSQLHQNVQDVFNEFGVQIMSPHYEADPADAKIVPRSRWYEAPAAAPPRGGAAA